MENRFIDFNPEHQPAMAPSEAEVLKKLVKKPSVPLDIKEEHQNFGYLTQGPLTSKLTSIKVTERTAEIIPDMEGGKAVAKVKYGDLTLSMPMPEGYTVPNLPTTARQLFDIFLLRLQENGMNGGPLVVTLDEYMELRGLKDRKNARDKLMGDTRRISGLTVDWIEPGRGPKKKKRTMSFTLVTATETNPKAGYVAVCLSSGYISYLKENYSAMPYPMGTLTINPKKNPNSYYFMKKINDHKYMNSEGLNEDILSVKTLLACSPEIPKYEELKTRHPWDDIIAPFERDMDALEKTITWEYCHSKGEPLTDEELNNFTYQVFEKCLVKIIWKEYPDQSGRLQARNKHIKDAQKKAEKAKKAKKALKA